MTERRPAYYKDMGTRPCAWCGEPFQWHPKLRVKFCSNSCSGKG